VAARDEYRSELVPVEEAVRVAHTERDGLVVLSDAADATTSGAPGDSTWLLRELVKYEWPRPALVTLVAADVVAEAAARRWGGVVGAAGWGARQSVLATAAAHDARGATVRGEVRAVGAPGEEPGDRHGTVRGAASRQRPHPGDIAVRAALAPEFFRSAGIDPFAASVLVAKSPCGFRAAYRERAKKILAVRSGLWFVGLLELRVSQRASRPLWPWTKSANGGQRRASGNPSLPTPSRMAAPRQRQSSEPSEGTPDEHRQPSFIFTRG
jgi:microcystin degradation protein MlrC